MKATTEQITELASTIADQAQAIADGTVIGPLSAATARLIGNVQTLDAWVNSQADPWVSPIPDADGNLSELTDLA